MAITYLSLDITCSFRTSASLPVFKGSALRGAFGHNLKKVSCALRKQDCDNCLLADSCAYALIFATEKIYGDRVAARPHPYIINPVVDGKTLYKEGDIFTFNLVLLGSATDYLPHTIYTLEEMGRGGLGRGNTSGAGKFKLQAVLHEGKTLYSEKDKVLQRPEKNTKLQLSDRSCEQGSRMEIELRTPLRVKFNNSFLRKMSFPAFINAAMRRVAALEKHYGNGDLQLDFRAISKEAESVVLTKEAVSWRDLKRYSNSQKTGMLIGGMVGSLEFSGQIESFAPLVEYASKVNLGKQTSFGLGKFSVQVV